MVRERFKELLSGQGEEKSYPISSFKDIVDALTREIFRRADSIMENQMNAIVNAYIIAISELLFFHIKRAIEEMAGQASPNLTEKDVRAALISFLSNLWDRKIKGKVLQLRRFSPTDMEELKGKFIDRILSRFFETYGTKG